MVRGRQPGAMGPTGADALARGITLVELMVALTLGLILSGAGLALFIGINRSFVQDDALARLHENGRHALDTLAADLAMADFWGEYLAPETIGSGRVRIPESDDCGTQHNWAITPQPAVESLVRAALRRLAR